MPISREPWQIAFSVRKARAAQSLRSGKRLTIMIYHHADTSTFRYRCYNVMQALDDSSTWDGVYFFVNEISLLYDLLPQASLLVLVRLKWEHIIDDLIHRTQALGIPVVYDIDDLVCDIRYLKTVTNTLNVHFGGEVDYNFWFADFSRLEYTASMVDGFIATNKYLGSRLSERFAKPFQIIPNSLNREQIRASELCLSAKGRTRSIQPFTIGYFSGTPSHINDFRTVSAEIASFLQDFPDAILQVVGFMEFPKSMEPLIKKKRIQYVPLVDFIELQRLIAEVDVNIVPLVQNIFTNCKSELKFFEAAIVETPTIAVPTYTYQSAIVDGENGFLCHPGDMYVRLKQLHDDKRLAKKISEQARIYCLKQYAGSSIRDNIELTYDFLHSL